MILKIKNDVYRVHFDELTQLHYVDSGDEVCSGSTETELIRRLKQRYGTVKVL